MSEKRKSERYQVDLKLDVSSLFKQDNVSVDNIEAPIEVVNISRVGIGFVSSSVLPLDYYFNAQIQLGDEDSTLYSVVKIIRKEDAEDGRYNYGAEFVGMPSVLMYIFDEYEEKMKGE